MRWIFGFLTALIGGSVAGGAVSAMVALKSPSSGAVASAGPRPSSSERSADVRGPVSYDDTSLRAELAKMRALIGDGGQTAGATPASSASSTGGPPTFPDVESANRYRGELFRAQLDAHGRESVDPAWGPAVAKKFAEDFRGAADRVSFSVDSVDCRTTTCVANVRFANEREAWSKWGSVMGLEYSTNCGVEVFLQPAVNATDPYTTQVLFNCEDERIAEIQK